MLTVSPYRDVSRRMNEIAFSTGFYQEKYGDRRALEMAKLLGADAVDFSLIPCDHRDKNCIYSHSDEEIEAYYADLRKYAESLGIRIHQTHGRLGGFKDPEWNEAMIANARTDCLATAALGAKYCVAHTVTTGYWGPDHPAEDMHRMNDEIMLPMIGFAKNYGVVLCTETFGDSRRHGCCDFFGNLHEFIKAYDRLAAIDGNAEHFKVCFDSGHTNNAVRFGNPTVPDAVRMLGDRIAVLHLHDNNGLADQHKGVGCGTINWKATLSALKEIGYDGVYNLEIGLEHEHFGRGFADDEISFSIKAMRNMLKTMI